MVDVPKYHLGPHGAVALLGPVGATLRELEVRVAHYRERLKITEADDVALREAHTALAAARDAVERAYTNASTGEGAAR